MSSSSCWYFQYSRTCGFRKYWIIIIYCTFYGVVEWFKKYISSTPKYFISLHYLLSNLHVHGVGFEHYRNCLKETLQKWSLRSFTCTQVLKCTNWTGIIFKLTVRSWKQTLSRRIEKLTGNKNGPVTWVLCSKYLCIFHLGRFPWYHCLSFLPEWFYSATLKKIDLHFRRCH